MAVQQQNSHNNQSPTGAWAAAGFHVVGRYRNRDGSLGVEIRVDASRRGGGGISYIGAWGVGRAVSRDAMAITLRTLLAAHPGAVAELNFGDTGAHV